MLPVLGLWRGCWEISRGGQTHVESLLCGCSWWAGSAVRGTLQVKERACICGFLWRSLGNGSEEGAVTLQNSSHEAQEGFLDLQLQSVKTFTTAQLRGVAHAQLQQPVQLTLPWGQKKHSSVWGWNIWMISPRRKCSLTAAGDQVLLWVGQT